MWIPWLSQSKKIHSSPNSPRDNIFSISSFKDIENLCNEEKKAVTESESHRRPPSVIQRARTSGKELRAWAQRNISSSSSSKTARKGIVLYYTSLHVVRRTYEDCRVVRSIIRGYRVPIDERDLSMDCKYINELHELMKLMNMKINLPAIFIGGEYIGGAEEIRRLQESGELSRLIEGLPRGGGGGCDQCGGLQFVVCEECSGSHKIYAHKLGFRNCTDCNANGLVRCPSCCPIFVRCRSSYS